MFSPLFEICNYGISVFKTLYTDFLLFTIFQVERDFSRKPADFGYWVHLIIQSSAYYDEPITKMKEHIYFIKTSEGCISRHLKKVQIYFQFNYDYISTVARSEHNLIIAERGYICERALRLRRLRLGSFRVLSAASLSNI